MHIPQQAYRWLVSIQIIGNEGIILVDVGEVGDKGMITMPASQVIHFESGFNIAEIVRSILKRSGNNIPTCLDNVRKDANKNSKLTNWNFVWLSFDQLRMQFDTRIKDLILQGQNALIVEIIKQLCDRDENKNQASMNSITIKQKFNPQKIQKTIRGGNKGNSLDIKKINLQKSPDESQSSLQFLILLLSSSLNMAVQQILGLFTNQNKFLAHIIVKGINDDFGGIILFYTLLNKHSQKLHDFIEQDKKDAQSCLYAIKPGFISKNQQVTQLTIQIFSKIGNIYDWLINQTSRGSTTLLLGIKRHPYLVDQYWQLLFNLIKNQEVQFFANYFKPCFKDSKQMIEICNLLIKPISQYYIRDKLQQIGIFAQWIDIAVNMFQGPLDDQLLVLGFLGQMMVWLPQSVSQHQECLQIFSKGWKQRKIIDYVLLIDVILLILDKLASNKSQFASKLYQIVIQIFQQIYGEKTKKQYLVENFAPLISQYPKMPSQYFIQSYTQNNLDPSDYELIRNSIILCQDIEGLAKIGQVILRIFNSHAVQNCYLGPLIYLIAKKTIDDQIGQAFITKAVKDTMYSYSIIQTTKKNPKVAQPQPMYFNYKGNSQKLSQEQVDIYKSKEKQSINMIQLIDKLIDLVKSTDYQNINSQIKQQLLQANSYIKKNNFKVVGKSIAALLKKFNVSKQEEQGYDEQYRNKKSVINMEQSLARKRSLINNGSALAASRIGGPEHLKKQFNEIVQKRKRQQQQKKAQQQKKQRQQIIRLEKAKKQLQRQQLIRGFGTGQAELKQQGFWNKLIKQQNKQLQLYPPTLMQQRDTDYIQNLFKKFHRVTRFLFLKYSSSMYSVKSINNFEDNQVRKETLNLVQAIKFLKDYKLFFLTNNNQVHNIIRDINVKLLDKRQTQQLDFVGFEHFLVQFSSILFVKPHSINTKAVLGQQVNIKKNLNHLSHAQLLEELFNYIKVVFQQRGEKTTMFDEPEAAYFNEVEVIKQFNKKIQQDPGFILPQGYKKVTDKIIIFQPNISEKINKGLNNSYLEVLQILDQILFSKLNLHILEPISKVNTKIRVKPHAFNNIKTKLLGDTIAGQSKIRAMSSAMEKKIPAIPAPKMMQRKVLSFGMKLGLSYVNYKDKLLGEQVAYVIDDMLNAIQNGRKTIQKNKIINQAVKKRNQAQQLQRQLQSQKEKKRKQRKQQLEKKKKQTTEKKEKQLQQTKQQREKKKQKQLQKQKKKKQDIQKYLAQQKVKLKDKKQKQEQQKTKQQLEKKKKKEQQKKAKDKFKQFNQKQIQKLKKSFQETTQQKKKQQIQLEEQKKNKDEMFKKLRSKISSQDKKMIQIRQRNNQQISQLFSSPQITEVFKTFQQNLKTIFDFLIKSTHLSLTQRKHNNQIILETWNYFNMAFQLNPYIINSKNVLSIFKSLTKDKQISKQYYIGLNFQQFQQALLRIATKHKTIFNKISEKIKENDMTQREIDAVIDKDIEQKEKNEFDEPKQIDVKSLLVEQDINKQVYDDYGEIKKVTPMTLKGLIYYLKVPKDKIGQQKRFRQIISQKNSYMQKYQKLKQKLKEQYTLQSSPVKKKKTEAALKSQQNVQPENPTKSAQKQIPKSKSKK